ncbi:MAG: elongation factor 4 [Nitrospinae bacterium]|nr:elongation factor 4 [Nitrospinota bacterium]
MNIKRIRNFSIIAHVDHGKSTLADRLLEATHAVDNRRMKAQFLDQMELERERGITIKAQTVRLSYTHTDGEEYILNLIDTPGHVDFSYEVSRSLSACEGALLVIDVTQGVQAQTLANLNIAHQNNLAIVPVLNKIDLPSSNPEMVMEQMNHLLQMESDKAILASAKKGIGINEILKAIVECIPAPRTEEGQWLKALIFDSWYDSYRGVVVLVRIYNGSIKAGDSVKMMYKGKICKVEQVGIFSPALRIVDSLSAGEVGFVIAGLKTVSDTEIGDTLASPADPSPSPLPGFKKVKQMVFSGLYPVDTAQFDVLRDALQKLNLNDSSFSFEPETSLALGFGFRCGFLGLLHMEIVRERLEREFGLNLISTSPTVVFKVIKTDGSEEYMDNPSKLPQPTLISSIQEPYIRGTVFTPSEYVGPIMKLVLERRGIQKELEYLDKGHVSVVYEVPFNEVVKDFYDKLKSVSRGFASFDYEHIGYRDSDLVKLDILINGDPVDAFSSIVFREKAYYEGRDLAKRMKEIIPRQMFEVVIQASIGSRVVAREVVKAIRKNVLAKCYGGDITRKRKLLEKQKEGKKRMKQIGHVEIPQEAFLAFLKTGEGN